MLTINRLSAMLAVSVMALGIGLEAQAHPRDRYYFGRYHRHPGFSFYFGVPLYPRPYSYPYYYPYSPYSPYYPYYPPEIVRVPVSPPVYIERAKPQPAQPLPPGYWYYCSDPEGYYPYVKECPSGWRQVDPVPPSPR